jgi:hypothetical protein
VPLSEATLILVTSTSDTLMTFSESLHNETEPRDEGIRCCGMEMTTAVKRVCITCNMDYVETTGSVNVSGAM